MTKRKPFAVAPCMKPTQAFAGIVASLVLAQAAIAGPIVVFDSRRDVVANAVAESFFGSGPWSATMSMTVGGDTQVHGSQTSNISSGFLGGTGLSQIAHLPGGSSSTFSASRLGSLFTIDEQFVADLDVEFETLGGGAHTRLFLFDRTNSTMIWEAFGTPEMATLISRDAILMPGTFQFFIETFTTLSGSDQAFASFTGGLALSPLVPSPVPEPASIMLLGLGLAGLAARRRAS